MIYNRLYCLCVDCPSVSVSSEDAAVIYNRLYCLCEDCPPVSVRGRCCDLQSAVLSV